MKTSEIRDKLLEKKTLYNQAVLRSEKACEDIQNVFKGISEEDMNEIQNSLGINIRQLQSINLEKMKTDSSYLANYRSELDSVITQLHLYLESALDV